MTLDTLANISDKNLLTETKAFRFRQCESTAEIVKRIAEIDIRGIYRGAGYSSLFAYCQEELMYSEGDAVKVIRAARSLHENPEVYELLKTGKISLCALSVVTPVINEENKKEVLAAAEGAYRRNAEKIAARFGAPEKPKRETIRLRRVARPEGKTQALPLFATPAKEEPQTEEMVRVSFEMTKEQWKLYETAREIVGPKPIADIMESALRAFVKKHRPEKVRVKTACCKDLPSRGKVNPAKSLKARSRVIPRPIRRAVNERDGGQCTYVSLEGKRCTERLALQVHHSHAFGLGGSGEIENLRLCCGPHNRLYAEEDYGREFVRQRIERRRR